MEYFKVMDKVFHTGRREKKWPEIMWDTKEISIAFTSVRKFHESGNVNGSRKQEKEKELLKVILLVLIAITNSLGKTKVFF